MRFGGQLTATKKKAARVLLREDIGVLVAPPGAGKTVIGTYLIAARCRSTLVLVHRQPLLDRVDRLGPDGSYEVVDYKTGTLRSPGGLEATFAGGRQLQHALYALAATELLRTTDSTARVSSGSYYFPTRRGRSQRVSRPQADRGSIAALLADLFDVVAGLVGERS